MSQNDFNLANQGFPSMRSDMNSALQALASNSSGATAPTTTYPYQWWYDETTDILKVRNAANAAWIDFATFDQTTDSWSFTSVDINGGTIDGTVIGGTTAAAISGTTGAFTSLTVDGDDVLTYTSDIETQVKTAVNATGSAPIYACRAWGNFDGDAITARGSGNLSIARTATGDFTFTMATAMPDVNYSVNVSCNAIVGAAAIAVGIISTTQFSINVRRASTEAAGNPTEIFVQVVR